MEKQVLDFIVIGGEKCGTTSLYEYLRKHPQLYLPPGKGGVGYFSNDKKYAQGWTEFLSRNLPGADPSLVWGTISPMYMFGGADLQKVPRRIQEQLPDVRLIAILRDPVQRARSHHRMATYEGWGEARSFATAVEDLLQPEALTDARLHPSERTGYIAFGEYGRVLKGFLEVFERDQLLVVYTSDLESNPQSVVRRIFEFLGVDRDFVPTNLGVRYLKGSDARRIQWLSLYELQMAAAKIPALRNAWHALPKSVRIRIDTHYRNLNVRVWQWNRREAPGRVNGSDDAEDARAQRRLAKHFEADLALLTGLVGETPPWAERLAALAAEREAQPAEA